MAIEIVDLPTKNGDFQRQSVSLSGRVVLAGRTGSTFTRSMGTFRVDGCMAGRHREADLEGAAEAHGHPSGSLG